MGIASYVEHTVLAANATEDKILNLCNEARKYNFATVCVNSSWVPFCVKNLKDTSVKVCSAVGFPLGAMASEVKAFEASYAVKNGAEEVDMVINVGCLKDKKDDFVEQDISLVKKACGDKVLKVIIETCLLTDEEKVRACKIAEKAGADFVKTSTGFSTAGAKAEDVALMRKSVSSKVRVKAAGGIRDYETALKMISSGADRLGCSAGIALVEGEEKAK